MNAALTALAEALSKDANVSEDTREASLAVLEAARVESELMAAYAAV